MIFQRIPGHVTMLVEEFDPDVFRQIIEYIHTSCITLQPRTLLGQYVPSTFFTSSKSHNSPGVLNAADYYGLDELKSACLGFIEVTSL